MSALCWHKPTYLEITGAAAQEIRAGLREQAYRDRQCWACLAQLRDRTSTYCSHACQAEMGDEGAVDLPAGIALIVRLPLLVHAMNHGGRHVAVAG